MLLECLGQIITRSIVSASAQKGRGQTAVELPDLTLKTDFIVASCVCYSTKIIRVKLVYFYTLLLLYQY